MSFTIDLIILLLTGGVLLAISMRAGKSRAAAIIVAAYVALLIFTYFPYTESISGLLERPFGDIAVFCLAWIFSYLGVKGLGNDYYSFEVSAGWLSGIILSVLGTGFIASVFYHQLSLGMVAPLSEIIRPFLYFPNAFFWWLVGGIAAVFFVLRR